MKELDLESNCIWELFAASEVVFYGGLIKAVQARGLHVA